jgi:hypothetical protein
MGVVANSYTWKGFLIYEEMGKYMRRPLVIYDFATAPFWISLYLRKVLFSFLSVYLHWVGQARSRSWNVKIY